MITFLFVLGALVALPIQAHSDTPSGHLDLDAVGLPSEATVDVSMGQLELALLAAAAGGDEAAALVASLESFALRQYEAPEAATVAAAEALADSLQTTNWVRTHVEVDGDREVHFFVCNESEDVIAGLVVLVIDPAQRVALANVVGDLPPDQLEQLGLPIAP